MLQTRKFIFEYVRDVWGVEDTAVNVAENTDDSLAKQHAKKKAYCELLDGFFRPPSPQARQPMVVSVHE